MTTLGTRSILFGAHCFFLHPLFVARAWWKLYGFPWDPRLWVAFVVHDLGYVGKPNMDGPEGETHPMLGAKIMGALFDWRGSTRWYEFALYHSRYYAKRRGVQFSRLCVADKLALALTPAWLYLPMTKWTGEIEEYMQRAHERVRNNEALSENEKRELTSGGHERWYAAVQAYMVRWVDEHQDGREDRWTGIKGEVLR